MSSNGPVFDAHKRANPEQRSAAPTLALTALQLAQLAAPILGALINSPKTRDDTELSNRAIDLAENLHSIAVGRVAASDGARAEAQVAALIQANTLE